VALVVQKYGGTSVADPDRIKAVADHVAFTRNHGNDVVVVVSAMGKSTDNLISLANAVSAVQPGREMDMLLTAGERISMSLLCIALAGIGVDAVSFTGSQVGIITDTVHKDPRSEGRPSSRGHCRKQGGSGGGLSRESARQRRSRRWAVVAVTPRLWHLLQR